MADLENQAGAGQVNSEKEQAAMAELQKNMQAVIDEEKGLNEEDPEAAKKKMDEYIANHSDIGQIEYLVRGATLKCRKGSHQRRLNLPKDHGVYHTVHPAIHELDCLPGDDQNIPYFGVCSGNPPTKKVSLKRKEEEMKPGQRKVVTGKKCEPTIVGIWMDTNEQTKIIDNGDKNSGDRELALLDLSMASGQSTPTTLSFLVCKYGGIIEPVDSGQQAENEDEVSNSNKETATD